MSEDSIERAFLAAGLSPRVPCELGSLTTYRVGGTADIGVDIEDEVQLADVARIVAAASLDVFVLGRGSNLLVSDAGFRGLVIRLGAQFEDVTVLGDGMVRVGGAASLPVVARRTVAEGLRGFEWAVGVPGSIGGAVRMNAGGHGSDMAARVRRVKLIDLGSGMARELDGDSCRFGYRSSAITRTDLVVHVDLQLDLESASADGHAGDHVDATETLSEIVRWRRTNQPGGQNAGSVFTNPPGDSAGRLIDAAGCKGLRIGSAEVSPKHANFIQADADGRADDVAALMAEVRRRVRERFDVDLHAETVMIGFDHATVEAAGAR